ncbi:MAG: type II secretion system protein GspG [Nitrospinae bacterium]|nr:type II secretion system protein GspG [Nitrospinota bacterium]
MQRVLRSEGGFTLIELVVVLAVIALLAATLTPLVTRYIQDARIQRAQNEVQVIGAAIQKFEQDLGRFPFFSNGAGTLREADQDVVVLQGPGDMPTEDTASNWTSSTVTGCKATTCVRGELAEQLIKNTPAYPTTRSEGKPFVWKGPFLDKLQTDPWGNKYLINIQNVRSDKSFAAIILSAGANGKVETAFEPTGGLTINLTPGGDDIVYRIR